MTASALLDAYGAPFDPGPAIERWAAGEALEATGLLWERLHHQGDIGTASYAALPKLVRLLDQLAAPDWNVYALIATIEEARQNGGPAIPPHLEGDYRAAWGAATHSALNDLAKATDDLVVRSAIAVLAHGKGQHTLAAIALLTEDERQEILG